MSQSLIVMVVIFVLLGSHLAMQFMESRVAGFRLGVLAPVPASMVVGVFTLTFVSASATDNLVPLAWAGAAGLAAWVTGAVPCLVFIMVRNFIRRRRGSAGLVLSGEGRRVVELGELERV